MSSDPLLVSPLNSIDIVFRLMAAVLFGGLIGLNRQIAGKWGGLRTHMLVSLGAALFVLAPLQASNSPEALSRTIQGITTGVGFLGAGEIVHYSRESGKLEVKGLTSAASIWVTAALGVIAGCGLWQISIISTFLTLIILVAAKWIENYLPENRSGRE